jgi:type II secretory pathway pseudopilin PulG
MRAIMRKNQRGASLVETVIALALLGIFGVTLLGALGTSSGARLIADEHTSGRILAESQMEYLRELPFASTYDSPPIPEEYGGYTTTVNATPLRNSFQEITVTVFRRDREVASLTSYKVSR